MLIKDIILPNGTKMEAEMWKTLLKVTGEYESFKLVNMSVWCLEKSAAMIDMYSLLYE